MFIAEKQPPVWKTLEEWEANKSTKWETALRILKRCLETDDDKLLPWWKETNEGPLYGELVLPDEETFVPDPNAKAKTVIYVEFTKPLDWFVPVSTEQLYTFPSLILSHIAAEIARVRSSACDRECDGGRTCQGTQCL